MAKLVPSGLLYGALAALLGCQPAVVEPRPELFAGSTMGTYYRVQVAQEEFSEERRQAVAAAIEAELEGVNSRMSTWIADSELSRFNDYGATSPFPLSEETFEVLRAALEISERTGGAFDVTVAPLVDAWGFGAREEVLPEVDLELIDEIRERVGYEKLSLDASASSVSKERGDLHADLSGIAKGYAIDKVAERLTEMGLRNYWVEVGGEVRASGEKALDQPWRLGIERPLAVPGTVQRIVELRDLSVATSGDYRNYREVDGERLSHLIDPRTGRPIGHRLASVSVFHEECMIADALATALMILGEEEGYAWAESEGLPVLFLVRDPASGGFIERGTPAFLELSDRQAPPAG